MSKAIEQNIEVGKFFKFGELGVAFEIIEMNGENAKIRVIESGEESLIIQFQKFQRNVWCIRCLQYHLI